MKRKILLNCLPPTDPFRPGYSLSVIKPYLQINHYNVDIKYWNIALRQVIEDFWFNQIGNIPISPITLDLMPFYNYYAVTRNDIKAFENIKQCLLTYFPNADIDTHLKDFANTLRNSIIEEFTKIKIENYNYVYVQSKFYKYQLIATGVLCEILKELYPHIITIIEAQEFERKAMALMDSFACYDYATWGEYEQPLLGLLDALEGNHNINLTPNIIYRLKDGTPAYSSERIKGFIDINETPIADFSDYMEQTFATVEKIIFPLESGRGCHWNSCSFCYMNDGYKYRKKSFERFKQEIQEYIYRYNAQLFYYIDNDVIGKDIEEFKKILSFYKEIKKERNFNIDFGEFIAKDIDAEVIKDMHDAGFIKIQIGYESTSDIMLKQINKKSHFSHLILSCKWCFAYGIEMSPQNILRSMPFETDSIILDNIQNLYYLRFLLSHKNFYHSLRELCVVSTSRYYNSLVKNGKITDWDYTPMQEYMPETLLKPIYKYDVFLMETHIYNPLWRLFKETERYYKTQKYSYSLCFNEDGAEYQEFINTIPCNKVLLTKLDIQLLTLCNKKVVSFADICTCLSYQCNEDEIKLRIINLQEMGLIYVSNIYDEIVSTISISSKVYFS